MSVAPSPIARFDQPHQFEPLIPALHLDALRDTTRCIFEKSAALRNAASEPVRAALREIVRSMNSYYSNGIEGQGTHPAHIERALHQDFSARPDVARRQRLALAHIDAERELEAHVSTEAAALSSAFVQQAHRSLYGRLLDEDRRTEDGRIIVPGELRQHDVTVGRHQPPAWEAAPCFLARMDEVYGRLKGVDAVLYTIACAHHRMMWTHPFEDGNGRAVRLQTHCALFPMSAGLWSVNRGLARDRDNYYRLLDDADAMRQGDLDGRGNLSEKNLFAWCRYFLGVCEDQVDFMARMLDMDRLKERIRAFVLVQGATRGSTEYRPEAVLPLQMLAAAGTLSRGEFARMTGLEERTARKVIARLTRDGLLHSNGHRDSLRLAFPLGSLGILFPNLYPEAGKLTPGLRPELDLLARQTSAVSALLKNGTIPTQVYSELMKLIRDCQDLQSRCDRIKDNPYPRQYAIVSAMLVMCFCTFLPFGVVALFSQMGVGIWLAVPFSTLIGWMYFVLDQVGESTSNPFEGNANDVPISRICRDIEIELRTMLDEEAIPLPLQPVNGIAT
ncbi:MAG: Fic family protein [Hyphomicrobiales bacterium]|nr:MAG: Fic family protein [Hyphomicrobiales bacterium]